MTNKIVPAVLLGSAIGDALGMPFERPDASIHPYLKDWEGGFCAGSDLPSGHWTDDTEMSMALASSLINLRAFSPAAVAESYRVWFSGNPTRTGSSTRRALSLGVGTEFQHPEKVGAGTVMRVAPLGVFCLNKPDHLRRYCLEDAYITHADREAYAASLAVSSFILGILRATGEDSRTQQELAVGFMRAQLDPVVGSSLTFRALNAYFEMGGDSMRTKDIADCVAGRWGSAWQIAITSIHCAITHWNNFEAGVMDAVKLGGDTDTRGAVTGAILGARLGIEGIPERWREGVFNTNMTEVPHTDDGWGEKGKAAKLLTQMDNDLFHAANT